MISSFGLLTPLNPAFCATGTPWIAGIRRVESREHLPSGGCLAVEISLSTAAYVFLVGRSADGELTALFPSECPAFKKIDALLRPGKLLRFPPLSDPGQGILALDDSPGMEKVYAIAITETGSGKSVCRPFGGTPGLVSSGKKFCKYVTGRLPDKFRWADSALAKILKPSFRPLSGNGGSGGRSSFGMIHLDFGAASRNTNFGHSFPAEPQSTQRTNLILFSAIFALERSPRRSGMQQES